MKYETIIFDLDGTLLDTLLDINDAINDTLKQMNLPYKSNKENARNFIGMGVHVLIDRVFDYYNINENLKDEFFKLYIVNYSKHVNIKTKPFDGVINTLNELKKEGFKLGVISNKPNNDVKRCLDDYFKDIFDFVIGQQEGVRTKPYPDIFYKMVDIYKFNKDKVLYVGDMDVDIKFAKNINVDVAIYSNGYGRIKVSQNNEKIFNKYEELLFIVREK